MGLGRNVCGETPFQVKNCGFQSPGAKNREKLPRTCILNTVFFFFQFKKKAQNKTKQNQNKTQKTLQKINKTKKQKQPKNIQNKPKKHNKTKPKTTPQKTKKT